MGKEIIFVLQHIKVSGECELLLLHLIEFLLQG